MTPEKLFHELLGLGLNWKVTECEFDRESGVVRLRIEETEHLWKVERSPDEGADVACYDHTEEERHAGDRHFGTFPGDTHLRRPLFVFGSGKGTKHCAKISGSARTLIESARTAA